MAETQRERVPRNDADELDTAMAFLAFARSCVIKKADGLTDEQLRRPLVESGTSILGLIAHLTTSERYWFGFHVAGNGADDDDWDFDAPPGPNAADVIADYRAAIAESDAIIRPVADPDARVARPVDGLLLSVRWVLTHMTSETARHAGHADILREQLDGTTGR